MYLDFWKLFAKGYGRVPMALLISGLALVIPVLEGFNIGLLVPLVESFQSSEEGGEHWITRGTASIFWVFGNPIRPSFDTDIPGSPRRRIIFA